MNLMLNGIEAMRESVVQPVIASTKDVQKRLVISVVDSGVELPTGPLEHLFSAFLLISQGRRSIFLPAS